MSAAVVRLREAARPSGGLIEYAGVFSLVVLFIVLSIASSAFLSKDNLLNVLQANSDIGIAACAGTLVIVAGGIDLSVGAIYALAGVLSAKLAISTGVGVGILAGVAAGVGVGLLNGLVVTVGRVNPLVGTLAGAIIVGGAAEVVAGQELLTPKRPPSSRSAATRCSGSNTASGSSPWLPLSSLSSFPGRGRREVKVVGANAEAARLRDRRRPGPLSHLCPQRAAAAVAGVVVVPQSGQAQSTSAASRSCSR